MNDIDPIVPEPVAYETKETPIDADGSRFVEVISGQFDADADSLDAAPPQTRFGTPDRISKTAQGLSAVGLRVALRNGAADS